MVRILGKITALFLLSLSYYFIIKYIPVKYKRKLLPVNKILIKYHPYIGIGLIIMGAIHGYTALRGALMFHTGYLLYSGVLITATLGFLSKKRKNLKKIHKYSGLIVIILFLLHFMSV